MAHRRMFVTESGAGFYRTRMLSAGDPVTLSGPEARLHERLGYVQSRKPRARTVEQAPAPEPVIPTVDEALTAKVVEPAPKRRASRKKAAPKQ